MVPQMRPQWDNRVQIARVKPSLNRNLIDVPIFREVRNQNNTLGRPNNEARNEQQTGTEARRVDFDRQIKVKSNLDR